MAVSVGVDTLCWHLRLERGRITVEDVLEDADAVGATCVQVNLHHVRGLRPKQLETLGERGRELGLQLLASGDFLGCGRSGDDPALGIGRIEAWLEGARALGSPLLRVVSGFYRADLAGRPDLIEAERDYVCAVLRGAVSAAQAAGVQLLLENHSDFTVSEYRSIIHELGSARAGVFLDLINPVAALDDPVPVVSALAPLAHAGHVKDYVFRSIHTDDGYHRRGFEVLYRYPGEGVAPLAQLVGALRRGVGERDFSLSVEGLDNRAGVHDQVERLGPSLDLLRTLLASS
jgi:sugar phosphate isomerase/epimerase